MGTQTPSAGGVKADEGGRTHMSRSEWRIDDRYELLDELATGGAGTVWRCRDVRSGAEHTVTLLSPRPNRQD